eukprot:7389544-Prymnesium_polylepis.2
MCVCMCMRMGMGMLHVHAQVHEHEHVHVPRVKNNSLLLSQGALAVRRRALARRLSRGSSTFTARAGRLTGVSSHGEQPHIRFVHVHLQSHASIVCQRSAILCRCSGTALFATTRMLCAWMKTCA